MSQASGNGPAHPSCLLYVNELRAEIWRRWPQVARALTTGSAYWNLRNALVLFCMLADAYLRDVAVLEAEREKRAGLGVFQISASAWSTPLDTRWLSPAENARRAMELFVRRGRA